MMPSSALPDQKTLLYIVLTERESNELSLIRQNLRLEKSHFSAKDSTLNMF